MDDCFWTDFVRCEEDCASAPAPAPAGTFNLFAADRVSSPTLADSNNDASKFTATATGTLSPSQGLTLVASGNAITRTLNKIDLCGTCDLGPQVASVVLRFQEVVGSAAANAWSGEVDALQITAMRLKDASSTTVFTATYSNGSIAQGGNSSGPLVFTGGLLVVGQFTQSPSDSPPGFSPPYNLNGCTMEFDIAYTGSNQSLPMLNLTDFDIVTGVECYC